MSHVNFASLLEEHLTEKELLESGEFSEFSNLICSNKALDWYEYDMCCDGFNAFCIMQLKFKYCEYC